MRRILPIVIASIALLYGSLDYAGIVDKIRGREAALQLWERLSTVPSGDSVMIFAEDEYFSDGMPFIIANSRNERVRLTRDCGTRAAAIARIGGIARPPATESYPADSLVRFYASPSSPIVIAYDYTRIDRGGSPGIPLGSRKGWALPLGSLGEIPMWIAESRSKERFIVYTVLLGMLSIFVGIQGALSSTGGKNPGKGKWSMRQSTSTTVLIVSGLTAVIILFIVIYWLPKVETSALAGIIGVLSGGAIALITNLILAVFNHKTKTIEIEQRFQEGVSQQALELTRMDYDMRMKGDQKDFLAPAKVYREFYKALTRLQKDGEWPQDVEKHGLLSIFTPSKSDNEQTTEGVNRNQHDGGQPSEPK